jgi:hypothetical protein
MFVYQKVNVAANLTNLHPVFLGGPSGITQEGSVSFNLTSKAGTRFCLENRCYFLQYPEIIKRGKLESPL